MIHLINQNQWQENNFYQHSTSRSKKDQKERLILFIKRQMMMLLVLQKLYSWKDVSPPKKKKQQFILPKSRDQKQSFCRWDKRTKRKDSRFETLSKENVMSAWLFFREIELFLFSRVFILFSIFIVLQNYYII